MIGKRQLYRALLRLTPRPGYAKQHDDGLAGQAARILARHRACGASFAVFERGREPMRLIVGTAGKAGPVTLRTCFRVASMSKMITALCALRLAQQGMIGLDEDIGRSLPFPVRHPAFAEVPVTLRMLLTHTSGIADAEAYHRGVVNRTPAPELLAQGCWGRAAPGTAWCYSNFGAGLVACVMESALGMAFEDIMQRHLFAPLGVAASFYPQRVVGPVADAFRVLPPWGKPGYDAAERKARPLPDADTPDPQAHYGLAQGNCVTDMDGMVALCRALMAPGYLTEATLQQMRAPRASFGRRSPYMRQGMGLFVIDDKRLSARTLYGHQGNAYGAMHGAFFEPLSGRCMIVMTSAASEAKTHFLSDLNRDLLRLCFGEEAPAHV